MATNKTFIEGVSNKIINFKSKNNRRSLMGLEHLSEEQHKKLGELLSSAIKNKEHEHPEDLQRASVIIYGMIKNNYPFDDTDIDLAIEATGEKYSDHIKKILSEMIDLYPFLIHGLENPSNERFMLKDGL